eukprot:762881-Hanusia_phi.AAC.4
MLARVDSMYSGKRLLSVKESLVQESATPLQKILQESRTHGSLNLSAILTQTSTLAANERSMKNSANTNRRTWYEMAQEKPVGGPAPSKATSGNENNNENSNGDPNGKDIYTPWRCEVCNIYFTSSQALGGHRINSTDHKQRMEKLRQGDTTSLPVTPRLSLHVYSNEEISNRGKRTRLPPMAQMVGFDRVLMKFPSDVRIALARIQSPAAYFSSCSLDVFRRHEKFGDFGCCIRGMIIDKYFTSAADQFEMMMQDPITVPELSQCGLSADMSEEDNKELKVSNGGAVSKRIKGIRKAGGERLKEFNMKKSRHNHSHSQKAVGSKR